MSPAQCLDRARGGQAQAFLSRPAGPCPLPGLFRSRQSLALPARAGRRTRHWAARAESAESLRGDHEPGPFVANAPRNASVPSIAAADRKKLTLPTILTLARLTALPIILAVWYRVAEPAGGLVASVFLIASATDYVDGYIARKMRLKTAFGAFLDPVVDKLLVAVVLVLLSTRPIPAGPFEGNTVIIPIISSLIISREILMSAVREWAATLGKKAYRSVQVSDWGKYKTGIQMLGLTLVLYAAKAAKTDLAEKAITFGLPLVGVAGLITLASLIDYLRKLWKAL